MKQRTQLTSGVGDDVKHATTAANSCSSEDTRIERARLFCLPDMPEKLGNYEKIIAQLTVHGLVGYGVKKVNAGESLGWFLWNLETGVVTSELWSE